MSLSFSTALRNAQANGMLRSSAVSGALSNCVITLYSGAVPASADAALGTAAPLVTYSLNGVGDPLAWGEASGGSSLKVVGDVWSGVAVATGTPTFFRYQLADDDGTESTTAVRMQGSVGLNSDIGAELGLSTLAITLGATQTIDSASVTVLASL